MFVGYARSGHSIIGALLDPHPNAAFTRAGSTHGAHEDNALRAPGSPRPHKALTS